MSETRDSQEERIDKQKREYQNIGRLWFGNGTEALIIAIMDYGTNSKGEPQSRFIIKPLRNCVFFNNIPESDYDKYGNYIFDVEKKHLVLLNGDPSNITWFSTIDLRKRKTPISYEPYIEQKEREISNVEETKKQLSVLNAKLLQEIKDITSGDFKEELTESIVSAVQGVISQAAQNNILSSLGTK